MTELDYEELNDPISKKMIANCQGKMPAAEIILKKTGVTLPRGFTDYYEKIRDFDVREDDLWVFTFPKSGTTWVQEMSWLLLNNLDYEGAKKVINDRFPFIDRKFVYGSYLPELPEPISFANNFSSPRFLKSHLHTELLPLQLWTKKPKIIYVARDPRDVVISYFHHNILLNNYKGSLDEFIEAFVADRVVNSPYWLHVLGFWKKRHEPNILLLTYEEMIQDLKSVVRNTASFLGVNISEDQENVLLEHLSFNSMKYNKSVNREEKLDEENINAAGFMREGKSGQWKNILTSEQIKQFESWRKKWLEGTDCDLYQ